MKKKKVSCIIGMILIAIVICLRIPEWIRGESVDALLPEIILELLDDISIFAWCYLGWKESKYENIARWAGLTFCILYLIVSQVLRSSSYMDHVIMQQRVP